MKSSLKLALKAALNQIKNIVNSTAILPDFVRRRNKNYSKTFLRKLRFFYLLMSSSFRSVIKIVFLFKFN